MYRKVEVTVVNVYFLFVSPLRASTLRFDFYGFPILSVGEVRTQGDLGSWKSGIHDDNQEPQSLHSHAATPERISRAQFLYVISLQSLSSRILDEMPLIGTGELSVVEALWFPHAGVDGAVKCKRDKDSKHCTKASAAQLLLPVLQLVHRVFAGCPDLARSSSAFSVLACMTYDS